MFLLLNHRVLSTSSSEFLTLHNPPLRSFYCYNEGLLKEHESKIVYFLTLSFKWFGRKNEMPGYVGLTMGKDEKSMRRRQELQHQGLAGKETLSPEPPKDKCWGGYGRGDNKLEKFKSKKICDSLYPLSQEIVQGMSEALGSTSV